MIVKQLVTKLQKFQIKKIQLKINIFQKYHLHGVEKNLRKDKHLKANIDKEIQIKLFKPVNKQKQYKGILKDFDNNYLTILSEQEIKIDRKNIAQIKTVYNW